MTVHQRGHHSITADLCHCLQLDQFEAFWSELNPSDNQRELGPTFSRRPRPDCPLGLVSSGFFGGVVNTDVSVSGLRVSLGVLS